MGSLADDSANDVANAPADGVETSTDDPSNSSLAQARAAFTSGDYAEVRRLLGPLRQSLPDGAARAQAEDLWARIEPDPKMSYLLLLSLLLLLAVTVFAYSSGHS